MSLIQKILCLCLIGLSQTANLTYDELKRELESYIENKQKEINQRYRPLYHVAPPVGWMNDPNGFAYHNGLFHLFYQFYPYDSKWGPMHWGHVTSTDLVHWKQKPTALIPEEEQCFSGSGISDDNKLVLMYTGHVLTEEEPFYKQSQYLALSEDGVNFEKFNSNPIIESPPNNSPDFRDPKIWKHGNEFYAVIGSKDNGNGTVLLYKSSNLKTWEYLSVLGQSTGELGYMWECPDFFELDGKFILLMSPQGVKANGDRYKNVYQTGYMVGTFDYNTSRFETDGVFQELDYGHDFYAATTTEAKGSRYLSAWFSMWEVTHPEDVDGWIGTTTLVRELRFVNNRLIMKPVAEIVDLRESLALQGDFKANQVQEFGKAVEILIEGNLNQNIDLLLDGPNGGGQVQLKWDAKNGTVSVIREEEVRRVVWAPIDSQIWRIFLDTSSLELFCGEGEVVFSSRVYPLGGWRLTSNSPQTLKITAYTLMRSVPDNASIRIKSFSGTIISLITLLALRISNIL
ncbi:sucrose-6-phosphate hydrolase-like [Danaus plexippus]|uniref:sucrose-6-phosphate hydrolase-like n=1 Tax=Danaus plexippus TaxID=13037 RepID=UPI002AB1D2FF|nr:sucrose-6-phosphate hydrolase-like [Danaus plexippus]